MFKILILTHFISQTLICNTYKIYILFIIISINYTSVSVVLIFYCPIHLCGNILHFNIIRYKTQKYKVYVFYIFFKISLALCYLVYYENTSHHVLYLLQYILLYNIYHQCYILIY